MPGTTVAGRDAAFAGNLTGWSGAVGGYLPSPRAFHPWSSEDWGLFRGNRKLPIWVAGLNGEEEAFMVLAALFNLGVPRGKWVAADLETRVDRTWCARFHAVMRWAGYLVALYGSTSTLFSNPLLDGWWVADPTGQAHLYAHPDVMGTQYTGSNTADDDVFTEEAAALFWQ